MNNYALQMKKIYVNESFEPVTNTFQEFQTFSSNLFSQIIGWITPMFENLAN